MKEALAWASEIMDADVARITEGMEDSRKREWLFYYPPIPPDLTRMKAMLKTLPGIEKVVRHCFNKAGITTEEIDGIIESNGWGSMSIVAREFADFDDTSGKLSPPKPEDQEERTGDPLTNSEKRSSTASPTIGVTTSRSSNKHMAAQGAGTSGR